MGGAGGALVASEEEGVATGEWGCLQGQQAAVLCNPLVFSLLRNLPLLPRTRHSQFADTLLTEWQ